MSSRARERCSSSWAGNSLPSRRDAPNLAMSKCTRLKLEVLLVIASVSFGGSARAGGNFLAGADFSGLAFFESRGITYKDGGQVQDGFHILKNHGFNCARLRLFSEHRFGKVGKNTRAHTLKTGDTAQTPVNIDENRSQRGGLRSCSPRSIQLRATEECPVHLPKGRNAGCRLLTVQQLLLRPGHVGPGSKGREQQSDVGCECQGEVGEGEGRGEEGVVRVEKAE